MNINPFYTPVLGKGTLTNKQLLTFAWEGYKNNWKTFVKLLLAICGVAIGFFIVYAGGVFVVIRSSHSLAYGGAIVAGALGFIWFALFFVTMLCAEFTPLFLTVHLGEGKTLKQLLALTWTKLGGLLVISIVYGLAVLIGTVLLVVPGIIIGLRYAFAHYVYITEDVSIGEAFTRSAEIIKGFTWSFLWKGLALLWIELAVTILAFLPLLGLVFNIAKIFVLAPVFLIYTYSVFLHIRAQKEAGVLTDGFSTKQKVQTVLGYVVPVLLMAAMIGGFVLLITRSLDNSSRVGGHHAYNYANEQSY